uniref:Uncharacterized protein n=1 Tax=Kalanchoe fedtschenkoi TaxID=63787 RepID=A0A7N0THK7_KALFE
MCNELYQSDLDIAAQCDMDISRKWFSLMEISLFYYMFRLINYDLQLSPMVEFNNPNTPLHFNALKAHDMSATNGYLMNGYASNTGRDVQEMPTICSLARNIILISIFRRGKSVSYARFVLRFQGT